MPNPLLLRAARREPTERTPIWLMRQAGRYLPEYRALRHEMTFLELCKSPRHAADIMLATVERLGVDAAILFSDILVLLEPMGLELEYTAGDGPHVGNPLRSAADVIRLPEWTDLDSLGYVFDAVRLTRSGLDPNLPLIGFAGAPFTLASYAIEGGSSRDYRHTKFFYLNDPQAWHELLGKLARAISLYLKAQIKAGADIVQLFDSWAGCLGVDDYIEFVLPHTRSVIESLPAEVPVIHFTTGNPALLPAMKTACGNKKNCVLGVDWRISLDEAWKTVGYDVAIQGNLDPTVLLGSVEVVRRTAKRILEQAGGRPGHIFNLGHGVLPQTPVENVLALIETVKAHS